MTSIYNPQRARDWLLEKSDSLEEDDLRLFIKILAKSMLSLDIYDLFYERIEADRENNAKT